MLGCPYGCMRVMCRRGPKTGIDEDHRTQTSTCCRNIVNYSQGLPTSEAFALLSFHAIRRC